VRGHAERNLLKEFAPCMLKLILHANVLHAMHVLHSGHYLGRVSSLIMCHSKSVVCALPKVAAVALKLCCCVGLGHASCLYELRG
jgi:hypothetical protein